MKTIAIAFTFLVLSLAGYSQDGRISGKILNQKTLQPIAGASVLLYNDKANLVKMEITDDAGLFVIKSIPLGNYRISISTTGFKPFDKTISLHENDPGGLQIELEPEAKVLQTVTVSAKKQLIERKIDKTVVNVESSLTAAGSNALELLEKAPGVDVDKDGKISLRGKEGVTILIDDRPAYLKGEELVNYLKDMPASALDKLEIMTNPSAKYDASGNSGIINIKTKKIQSRGFNGNANISGMYSDRFRGNGSVNLNYRKNKTNLFGTYSSNIGDGQRTMLLTRNFKNADSKELEAIFDQKNKSHFHSENQSLKFGMDYYATKNTIAGFVLSGNMGNRTQTFDNHANLMSAEGNIDSMVYSTNKFVGKRKNFSSNLNLRHTFDSSGKKVTADLDYIIYNENSTTNVHSDYLYGDGSVQKPASFLTGKLPGTVKIYSAKTDVTFPFKNGGKIETGLKSSYVITDNNAIYFKKTTGEFEPDNEKTNHFIYKENINALYLNYNRQINKWRLQAGLRAEQTVSRGSQLGNEVVEDSSFKKNYINLFPTFYISFAANQKNTLSANYGRRINRPDYGDLNPFLFFIDEYTYEAGNVFLQPEITDQIELSHTYDNFLNSSISYSHTSNAISQVLKQVTEKRITYQTNENIADRYNLTISSGANLEIGDKTRLNIDGSLINSKYQGRLDGAELNVNSWMFMGKASAQIKFNNGWNSEVSGFYRSATHDGQIYSYAMWRADFAIQKTVLKKKGNINFFVRDLFNTQLFKGNVHYNEIDLVISNKRVSRTAGISFTYRFGKPIKNLKQRQSGGANEELNRIKSE